MVDRKRVNAARRTLASAMASSRPRADGGCGWSPRVSCECPDARPFRDERLDFAFLQDRQQLGLADAHPSDLVEKDGAAIGQGELTFEVDQRSLGPQSLG